MDRFRQLSTCFKFKCILECGLQYVLYCFFQLLLAIPAGFVLACMINRIKRFQSMFKVLFFLPNVTSIVAAAMIFMFVLQPEVGLINHFLDMFGLPTSPWLSDPSTSKAGVILLAVWHWLGFVIIICLANLQAISPELYEAAEIDGASSLQQWLFITIPNMAGTFAFLFIMGWISGLQRFQEVFVLGGPGAAPAVPCRQWSPSFMSGALAGLNLALPLPSRYCCFSSFLHLQY